MTGRSKSKHPDSRAVSVIVGVVAAIMLIWPSELAAQATVSGRVLVAETGAPVAGVVIRVEGVERSTLSDSAGRYILLRVPPGPQTLRAERLGYAALRLQITVPAQGTLRQDLLLAETALELEGVVVTADQSSRARGELGTASVIGEEAIRAQTAVSLAGVLELVPGMQLQPPGLETISQVSLRSVPTSGASLASGGTSAGDLASFGTLIVLDGVPMSNNTNLQTLGTRGELSFMTSAGGGVDLRRIPAATLERVEVIRGVPSARYGDLTQGAIVVDTRAAAIAPEVLGRYDARSAEVALSGGREFQDGSQAASLTFDLARTRSQPGLSDDHTLRLAGQLAHRYTTMNQRLVLDTRLDAFQLYDDRPENENVRPNNSSWNRDRGLRLSERAILTLPFDARLIATGAYTRTEQRSYSTSPRARGPQPFTDRLTEGRAEGRFVGGLYQAEVEVDGAPQMLYSRVELAGERDRLGFLHDLRIGAELRREWNSGPGYQFDMEFPPQVSFNAVEGYDRPRRYDQIPPLVNSAFYLDDRMTRVLGGDVVLNVQAGLRLDVLNEGSWWISGVRDAVAQPRLNVELIPRPWLRVRGGWGRTAKLPSLGHLFPAPQYHDVVNVNWYTNDPAERLAILTTTIKDPTNASLGMSTATKSEAGLELLFGGTSLQLVGFSDRIEGGVGLRWDPETVLRDHYALSDSTLGTGVPPSLIEPPARTENVPVMVGRPDNLLTQESRGVELTAFLPEFRPLRTRLQVQGAFIRTRQSSDVLYFGRSDIISDFQLSDRLARIPYWAGGDEEGERALATYRLIHHQPELGFIVTFSLQHNLHDRRRDHTASDTLSFLGYLTRDAELVEVSPADRGAPEYADLRIHRTGVVQGQLATPADWLMSLQASKTLPLDGRLSFWAFNVFDNPGIFIDPGIQPRTYPAVRFGLELSMPTRGFQELFR